MNITKVGIVGLGYVGKAMKSFFSKKYQVYCYDKFISFYQEERKKEVNECDLSVVCVPTPMLENGECDTSIVEETLDWIETPLILIKSTIPPGTVDYLKEKYPDKRITFSPEYCGESDYNTGHDFVSTVANEPFFIFGGDKEDTTLLVNIFSRIAGPTKKYMQCTAKEAETIKYFENTTFGVKVVMVYEFFQICKSLGVDWNTVREGWLLDPRIGSSHTSVFSDNIDPFGGKCLPKDINALVATSKKSGYSPDFIIETLKSNKRLGKIRSE